MYALVYHGPGRRAWEEVPDPEIIDECDVIVRVDATTICGTDLHILAGDVPEVLAGRILGHEAVGTVDEVGDGVHRLSPGDRVLVSCISAWTRAAGCSAAASTEPRPSTSASPTPTRPPTGSPTACRTRPC